MLQISTLNHFLQQSKRSVCTTIVRLLFDCLSVVNQSLLSSFHTPIWQYNAFSYEQDNIMYFEKLKENFRGKKAFALQIKSKLLLSNKIFQSSLEYLFSFQVKILCSFPFCQKIQRALLKKNFKDAGPSDCYE